MKNFQINCHRSYFFGRRLLAGRFSSKSNIGKRFCSMESRATKAANIESSTRNSKGRIVVDSSQNVKPQGCMDIRRDVGGVCFRRRFGDAW